MRTAMLCNKWKMTFPDFVDEASKDVHARSYLHYIYNETDLVAAKCLATEWLLKNSIDDSKNYSAREYMAGAGIQSTIIQNTYSVFPHIVSDIDEKCCEHIENQAWKFPLICTREDAKKSILIEYNPSTDIRVVDFPNSSILTIIKYWQSQFDLLFKNNPKMVVWTDTAISYPIKIHGEKYSRLLGVELKDWSDYYKAYSFWLYKRYNYSIFKVAVRGRNASYFCALPGRFEEPVVKKFSLEECREGFYFLE